MIQVLSWARSSRASMLKYNLNAHLRGLERIGAHSCTVAQLSGLECWRCLIFRGGAAATRHQLRKQSGAGDRYNSTEGQYNSTGGRIQYKERRSGGWGRARDRAPVWPGLLPAHPQSSLLTGSLLILVSNYNWIVRRWYYIIPSNDNLIALVRILNYVHWHTLLLV